MSDSLWTCRLQHARPPCPFPTLRVYSNACPLSQWCHPTISSSVIPFSSHFNPSQHQGLFQWDNSSHEVTKVLEFQLQHQSSNDHPGLISFRMDWLDILAVQGTLKGLPQHHSSKASILRHSAFFTVQLSHPYMTTGKTIALTRWTFVGKIMSLLFNMLSRLVITFLSRSKCLLISWLQSPSAVILSFQVLVSSFFFFSKVFYSFQCINLSVPKETFVLPCLGPLESGMGKIGSWREWMSLPSPLNLLSGYLYCRCVGPCPQVSPLVNLIWSIVFTLLLECPQALPQCLAWVQEAQVYLHVNDLIRPSNYLQ